MSRANRDRGAQSRRYVDLSPLIEFGDPIPEQQQQQQQQQQNVPKSMETLCRELDKMRTQDEAGLMCDFKLVCKNKDKTFPCHKVILAARSEYFRRLFGNKEFLENKKDEMTLTEEEEKHVDAFLCYIYGGKLKLKSSTKVVALLRMADKYLLEDLKNLCEEYLICHAQGAFLTDGKEFLRYGNIIACI